MTERALAASHTSNGFAGVGFALEIANSGSEAKNLAPNSQGQIPILIMVLSGPVPEDTDL